MTSENLSAICGVLLSLVFSYVPGLNARWNELAAEIKRLAMLILLVLVTGSVFGLACSGWGAEFGVTIDCSRAGLVSLINALIYAVMANQSTYMITRKK
jgi:hypothetical protein